MTTAPIHHEPTTDAPDLPIIAVDAELMETIAHRHGLTIEFDGSHGYMQLDGLEFVAAIEAVA